MKIELVLTNPLLVDHFAPIVGALQRHGCETAFVCQPPGRLVLQRAHKLALYERCVEAATHARLPLRFRGDPKADVALTALGSNELHMYTRIKLKLRYGVSLHRAAIHHNWAMTRGFDGMLVHGAFEQALFSRWLAPERIRLIGMPRHAAYLAQPLDKHEARAQLGLDVAPGRAVVSYLPTWSKQSSLPSFGAALAALAQQHLLLVKPHALSLVAPHERAALAQLRRAGAYLVERETELSAVLAAADLVMTDSTSGATAEALLLAPATPLLLLSVRPLDELFREIELAGPRVCNPARLAEHVAHGLGSDSHRAPRMQLRSRLFADCQGRDADIAAQSILTLSKLPKRSGAPGVAERSCPRVFRVARGRATALAAKYAPIPPRNVAAR